MEKTNHIFYVGDASQNIRRISKNSIQLVITSPPYWKARDYGHHQQLGFRDTYRGYINKMSNVFKECVRVLLPDGKIALNIGNIYDSDSVENRVHTINIILDLWRILSRYKTLRYMGTLYWKKSTSRNGHVLFGSYPYPSNFMISTALEAIHIFRKIGARKVPKDQKKKSRISKAQFKKIRNPIWQLNGIKKKTHPAVFPPELPRRLIKMYSFVGDTIMDPFCGVGTTNLEALKLGRNSIGIDVKNKYISIAVSSIRRTKKYTSISVYNNPKMKHYE